MLGHKGTPEIFFLLMKSVSLLHSISSGFVSLFRQVVCFINYHLITFQHISFNSVVSLSYEFTFIPVRKFAFIPIVDGNVGHGSFKRFRFQSIFTRKHSSAEHPSNSGDGANDLNHLHFCGWQNRGSKIINK